MKNPIRHGFACLSEFIAKWTGSVSAFFTSVAIVGGWAIWAHFRDFNSESQMPINSFTTIVTFIMVFIIQNSQNRETRATQLKLDELIRVNQEANNRLMKAESKNEDEIEELDKDVHGK